MDTVRPENKRSEHKRPDDPRRTRPTTGEAPDAATDGSRARPVYTSLGAFGLVLLGLAPTLLFVIGAATGLDLGGGMFFLIGTAISWLAAALVWRFGTWAKILGVVAAVVMVMGFFWLAFGLVYPASFGDFTPAVMFVLGVVLALFGCVAAVVQSRRKRLATGPTGGERRVILASTAVVAAAAVISAGLWAATRSSVDTAGAEVAAEMHDFAFDQDAYEVTAGQTLGVHNADGFVHDFTVHELDIAQTLLPGEDAVIDIPDRPGTYTIYCTLHSDPAATDADDGDMVATLVVR